jgi:hypothetical protein
LNFRRNFSIAGEIIVWYSTLGDAIGDIMDRKKLRRLKRRLDSLRGSPRKPRQLEALAKAFGRKQVKRGKHPTWESEPFQQLPSLTIPHHGRSGDVSRITTESILDYLERFDLAAWEERLESEGACDDDD